MMMIGIRRVKKFPRGAKLSKYAQEEFQTVDRAMERAEYLVENSKTWLITYGGKPVLLIGVYKLTFLGFGNRIWLVAFAEFSHRFMRLMRFLHRGLRLLVKKCGHLSLVVDCDNDKNIRFVRHLGFTPDGNVFPDNGRRFQYYIKRPIYGSP